MASVTNRLTTLLFGLFLLPQLAQAGTDEAVSFEEAFGAAAFINCLAYTHDGIPVSTLSEEGHLVRMAGSDQPVMWQRSFSDGYIILHEFGGASRACSTLVYGAAPDEALQIAENVLAGDTLPEPMRFIKVSTSTEGEETSSHYRQTGDQSVSAVLTTRNAYRAKAEGPTAILTFFREPVMNSQP